MASSGHRSYTSGTAPGPQVSPNIDLAGFVPYVGDVVRAVECDRLNRNVSPNIQLFDVFRQHPAFLVRTEIMSSTTLKLSRWSPVGCSDNAETWQSRSADIKTLTRSQL